MLALYGDTQPSPSLMERFTYQESHDLVTGIMRCCYRKYLLGSSASLLAGHSFKVNAYDEDCS